MKMFKLYNYKICEEKLATNTCPLLTNANFESRIYMPNHAPTSNESYYFPDTAMLYMY